MATTAGDKALTSLRIKEEVLSAVKAIARTERRSVNGQLIFFIEAGLSAYRAQYGALTSWADGGPPE